MNAPRTAPSAHGVSRHVSPFAASHPTSATTTFAASRASRRVRSAAAARARRVSGCVARASAVRRAISAATALGGGTNLPKISSCVCARFSESLGKAASLRALASTNASSAAYVAEPLSAPQSLASTLATSVAPFGTFANNSRTSSCSVTPTHVSQSVSTVHSASSAPSSSPVSATEEGTCVACPLKWKNKTSPAFAPSVSHAKPASTFARDGASVGYAVVPESGTF